jgi:hypothetical protein
MTRTSAAGNSSDTLATSFTPRYATINHSIALPTNNRRMSSPDKKKIKPDNELNARDLWYVHMGKHAYDFAYVHKVTGEVARDHDEMLKFDRLFEMKSKSVLYEDNHGNQFYVTENQDKIGALMGDRLPQAGGIRRVEPRKKEVINVDSSSSDDEDTKQEAKKDVDNEVKTPEKPEFARLAEFAAEEVDSPGECKHCGYDPCVVLEFEVEVHQLVEGFDFTKTTNNIARKEIYRFFSNAMHGVLGKGKRRELPACVLTRVRKYYPEKDGNYMGYKEKAADVVDLVN